MLPIRILLAACGLSLCSAASAATRIALIVGNSEYTRASLKLANPANDARAMERALRSAGFDTIVRLDARRRDLYRAVDEFSARMARDPESIGLFYYAGHGVQVDGTNYLIPVDAEIESVADLEASAFDVGRVLHAMQSAQNGMNIVVLDACRDNPLPRTRGIERGLARMSAPSGTFIAYAAAPGEVAQDGALGTNGVFTAELIKAMAEPGVPLEQMFKRVIAAVKADTRGRQIPWSESSLAGDFYFHEAMPAASSTRTEAPAEAVELAYWQSIKASHDPADFRAYLARFPHGNFAALAANRMKTLESQRAASSGPKKPQSDRCQSILERAQVESSLSDDDRSYLKAHCS